MTTRLFTQLEECPRDFDVGKHIDPREAGVTHFEQAMLPRNARESIDNPGHLVVIAIASGARAIDTLRAIVLLYGWQEFLADSLEDEIAPNADVIQMFRSRPRQA